MQKQYKTAVVIGRFQPHHQGHLSLFRKAAELADNIVIIVGSSYIARNIKNPFTFEEREAMLYETVKNMFENVYTYGVTDYMYNDSQWISEVSYNVDEAISDIDENDPHPLHVRTFTKDVVIVGYHKDASSWYLDKFPQYDYVEANSEHPLDATTIREQLFTLKDDEYYAWNVPKHVFNFLMKFVKTDEYVALREEYEQNVNYKKPYIGLPYPPIFQTVDAVVFCKSHFLVVKRRASPGKGLLALPGGFLNVDERINNGILRELLEETRIKVREDKLVIRETKTFDHPNRSLRGRTITTTGLIILDDEHELPKVRGSDDAEKAKWIPISKLHTMSDKLFEDHFSILNYWVPIAERYGF